MLDKVDCGTSDFAGVDSTSSTDNIALLVAWSWSAPQSRSAAEVDIDRCVDFR